MKICKLTDDQFDAFLKFNVKINPDRDDIIDRLKFQIFENPFLKDPLTPEVLVAFDDDNNIIGQHLHDPFMYHFDGKYHKGFYGYDYYVVKEHRKKGIGTAIATKSNEEFYPHFGVGVSNASIRILLSLGNKIIGNMFWYIWPGSVLSLLRMVFNSLFPGKIKHQTTLKKNVVFPSTITLGKDSFKRVDSLDGLEYHHWDDQLLEFSRSFEFLDWRFFKKKAIYSVYLLDESMPSTYFVVRKIASQGLTLLALVDYRVPFEDKKRFKLILRAAKFISKTNGFDGIYAMSSLSFFDKLFRQGLFIKTGDPIPMILNAKLVISNQRIENRQAVFATMADSDLDFYFKF
jgi:hypothetical protein